MKENCYNNFNIDLTINEYIGEFNQVLRLFIYSYKKMLLEKKFNLNEWENFLRNILITYLRTFKKEFDICHLNFYAEVQETSADLKEYGSIDIHISNPLELMGHEEKYYSFECKRLDGYSEKNKAYIEDGLFRYISGKYSEEMPIAGMIGFVQGFKKNSGIDNLITEIANILHKTEELIQNLLIKQIYNNFKYSYYSKHKRKSELSNIDIYHLFFDFT